MRVNGQTQPKVRVRDECNYPHTGDLHCSRDGVWGEVGGGWVKH